jgi:hypothetical protein
MTNNPSRIAGKRIVFISFLENSLSRREAVTKLEIPPAAAAIQEENWLFTFLFFLWFLHSTNDKTCETCERPSFVVGRQL